MDPQTLKVATAAVRLYVETHPRPACVTQKQAAEMLGISEGTMTKLVRAGTFKLNGIGQIPIGQIDEALAVSV